MTEASPQPADETLAKFPDLARARELYIQLFKDRSPLVNLGYTNRQIEFATPVLSRLQDEGAVSIEAGVPYLSFDDDIDYAEAVYIHSVQNNNAFFMDARRDESWRRGSSLTGEEKLMRLLFTKNPIIIFEDIPYMVAQIGLFKEGKGIDDLDYLVQSLHSDGSYSDVRLISDNILSRAAKSVGAVSTYKAGWVDLETKLEFMAKIDTAERGSICTCWRRLNSISDRDGSVVPFGRKAGVSKDKVDALLSRKEQSLIRGRLAFGGRVA